MNIDKTTDSNYTVKTEKEERSFSSPEEAKSYLKGTGLSDSQINDIFNSKNQSTITNVSRKTSITIGKHSLSFPSTNYCPNCKKELSTLQKRCPFCFREIKKSFWKKILGIK